jgi:phenylalanine-4-hydroxylase
LNFMLCKFYPIDTETLTPELPVFSCSMLNLIQRHISELDLIANRTLDAGQDLESDHPGFTDMVYRTRRAELAESAQKHNIYDPIPYIKYTKEEVETWTQVWDRMEALWDDYACKEYKVRSVNVLNIATHSMVHSGVFSPHRF